MTSLDTGGCPQCGGRDETVLAQFAVNSDYSPSPVVRVAACRTHRTYWRVAVLREPVADVFEARRFGDLLRTAYREVEPIHNTRPKGEIP